MKAEIVSIGRELLMGETQDTNACYLARQLTLLGIELESVCQVGDRQEQIVDALKRAWDRSDLVLTTGGLGPTGDDLTRESVAEMMGEVMSVRPDLEEALRQRFRRLGVNDMPPSNIKQCTLIPCAEAIENEQGTAPGWWVEKNGKLLVCMPGPPREMYSMWEKLVCPRLRERSGVVILAKTWKTFGLSEAAVGEMTFPLFTGENPSLGVYARPDGIHVELKVTAPTETEAREIMARGEARIVEVLGPSIWGVDNDSLVASVGRLLKQRGLTVSVMEDYSAGLLATSFAEAEGDHTFFRGGVVAVTDEAKVALGVPEATLRAFGIVSAEAAEAMADAVRMQFGSSIGIGVTGAEDAPQSSGGVFVAVSDGAGKGVLVRPRNPQRLVTTVLFDLRKKLLGMTGSR